MEGREGLVSGVEKEGAKPQASQKHNPEGLGFRVPWRIWYGIGFSYVSSLILQVVHDTVATTKRETSHGHLERKICSRPCQQCQATAAWRVRHRR